MSRESSRSLPLWPYHRRTWLAELYMHQLFDTGRRRMTLVGPAGSGKTSFLLHDMLQVAANSRAGSAYLDCRSYEAVIPASPFASASQASALHSTLAASDTPLPESEIAWHSRLFASRRSVRHTGNRPAEPGLPRVAWLERTVQSVLEQHAHASAPIVLMIDHADSLSPDEFDRVVQLLITVADARTAATAWIVASSMRRPWASVDVPSTAPLAEEHVQLMPYIGEDFLHTVSEWARTRLSDGGLNIDRMRDTWHAVGRSPRLFRDSIHAVLCGNAENLEAAADMIRLNAIASGVDRYSQYRLTDLQAVLLREIGHSRSELYSAPRREQFARDAGVSEISKTEVQGALKRLERSGLVYRTENARYALQSTDLQQILVLDEIQLRREVADSADAMDDSASRVHETDAVTDDDQRNL